ncbi:MAG: ABC transporter ATP-binding protein [Armatimonadetes bacterium]|nr:ABC transporter ATP-binding protein [Armatimonadota bacterium]
MIQVDKASLVYNDHGRDVYACRSIDLEVKDGEFLGILGPSGSGKSSLLYLMCGLKTPHEGQVLYRGRVVQAMDEQERASLRLNRFGFVFQYPYLLGYLSALENVLVAQPSGHRRAEAVALLESLGLGDKLHRLPHELSGGEKQRVCIARALLGGREVIFADEPTANLDHRNGVAVVETLVASRGTGSLVMVTHDPTMLEKADRVVTIADGELVQ